MHKKVSNTFFFKDLTLIKSLESAVLLLNKSGNHSVRCVTSLTCFSMFVKGTKVKMRNVV